ncbi:MAG TPA: phosphatase PAP2 family protein [Kofleriaceae bacterium]|nr:phosphatase PAP2 family protein [Kofleriaceae bacterium]
MRRTAVAALVAAATAATAGPARPAAADELVLRPKQDVPLLVGGGLVFVLAETVFKAPLSPDDCRWCGTDGFDRSIRDHLRWSNPDSAAGLSNWAGYVVTPVAIVGAVGLAGILEDRGPQPWSGRRWWTDGLIVVESAVLASDFTDLVKIAAGRERPFVHALAPADKPLTASPQENNLSFFSGHSSLTMSLAVSAGTVASLRHYRLAPAIWIGGVGLALGTGYLRIAGDRHWASDVLTGWAVGAGFGFAVPYFLHRKRPLPVTDVAVAVGPRAASLSFRW